LSCERTARCRKVGAQAIYHARVLAASHSIYGHVVTEGALLYTDCPKNSLSPLLQSQPARPGVPSRDSQGQPLPGAPPRPPAGATRSGWCGMGAVWRRTAAGAARSLRHRANRVWLCLRPTRGHLAFESSPLQSPSFPRAPEGTPAGPPLSHPERHVQTAQHRTLPGSGARRRGCRGALGAWEEPRRGGEKFLVAPVSLWYHALYS
jgi:hypothetical protein